MGGEFSIISFSLSCDLLSRVMARRRRQRYRKNTVLTPIQIENNMSSLIGPISKYVPWIPRYSLRDSAFIRS
jgi:hypothetical protein